MRASGRRNSGSSSRTSRTNCSGLVGSKVKPPFGRIMSADRCAHCRLGALPSLENHVFQLYTLLVGDSGGTRKCRISL